MRRRSFLVVIGGIGACVLGSGLTGTIAREPRQATTMPAGSAVFAYKGRQVSAGWVDRQYAYFKDKIAHVDGHFYDIGRALVESRYVTATPPSIGEARRSGPIPWVIHRGDIMPPGARVLQLVGKDEAIIDANSGREPNLLFHVRGIDPAKQIDGTPFHEVLLVYVGTYQYVTTMGAKATIQSFAVYRPITREQFVQALGDGFELVRYRKVIKKVPEMRGGSEGTGFGLRPSVKVMVDKEEIVAQVVPPPPGPPAPKAP